jgi:hypothetical protein
MAVAELVRPNVLHTGEGIIRCYDDHDDKHVFDLKRGHYTVAGYGNLFTSLVVAARRPGPDVLDLPKYSYIVK